ncbi:MAG TPA: PEGA domain-containing protein [Polyangiales bacterium]|nr:PEGA domain-containing protein [Polyangiales bacterium]
MSHDEGSSKPGEAELVTDDGAPSLRDTQPGVPVDMELSRTLPTGAAFHMTWRSPQPQIVLPNTPTSPLSPDLPGSVRDEVILRRDAEAGATVDVLAVADTQPLPKSDVPSPMPNTPASLPKTPAATAKIPVPPVPDGPSLLGTTRKEFGGPQAERKPAQRVEAAANKPAKLSPREKARRNMLTHTLQMPLVISPMQPTAAAPASRATQRQGSVGPTPAASASPTPGTAAASGWQSMQRIGAGDAPEPSRSRPSPRHTDPMVATVVGGTRAPEPRRPTSMHEVETAPTQPNPRPDPASWQGAAPASPAQEDPAHWVTRMRTGDFDRITEPNAGPIRVPSLNAREWMFIGLLVCASAATLYSLLVDDITPVEEDVDAATNGEHLVTPAEPAAEKVAPKPSAAIPGNTTEIVSDPPHAEVVLGGAVIGNTPTQVVRGTKEADYLLRKQGYESQLVRVTPHSGNSISITLRAKQPPPPAQ